MTAPTRRVLFVSYVFPPLGGVGVQRTAGFVRHLPGCGWSCSVLTANAPQPLDPSMTVPDGALVRRTRTLEPRGRVRQMASATTAGGGVRGAIASVSRSLINAVLVPDVQRLWSPVATRAGLRLLREVPHDMVVATGPPFSSFGLAARIARRAGLPLVLDYRDEWQLSSQTWENKSRSPWVLARQQRAELRCLRAASAIVATTAGSATELSEAARRSGIQVTVDVVANGTEVDDFTAPAPIARVHPDHFVLGFIGTLWAMADLSPLVQGVRRLAADDPAWDPQSLCLVVAGRHSDTQAGLLADLERLGVRVQRRGVVPHSEALELMAGCDGLLVLNGPQPSSARVINAKTYEYLVSNRPVLAITPEGDLSRLLDQFEGTLWCPPEDPARIARALRSLQSGAAAVTGRGRSDLATLDRRSRAAELACVLDRVVATPPNWSRRRLPARAGR